MKLLTKEIEKKLIKAAEEYENAPVAVQREFGEQTILLKLFYPAGYATWFLTAYYPKDRVFSGWCAVVPGGEEAGYVSLDELEEFRGVGGLKIERDLYFQPVKVKDCKELERYGYRG